MSVVLVGGPEFEAALMRATDDAKARVSDALQATGLEVRGDIVKRIQGGPATGTIYERGGISHQASAAGEAPATDQGGLANGTLYRTVSQLAVEVYNTQVQAAALEFGHDYGGGRVIEARPSMVPAVEKIKPKYIKRIERALGEAFR